MAVTANDFRRIALSFPESEERAHMEHPDFRVGNKIFATLGYPDDGWGMVKLSPKDQMQFVEGESKAFVPVKGVWGRQGATIVRLSAVSKAALQRALTAAWKNRAPKRLVQQFGSMAD
jgi:hypothetical protein